MKLELETRRMLKKSKLSPEAIARVTGLNMRFIYRFKLNESEDYGIRRVAKLYNYLKRRK